MEARRRSSSSSSPSHMGKTPDRVQEQRTKCVFGVLRIAARKDSEL